MSLNKSNIKNKNKIEFEHVDKIQEDFILSFYSQCSVTLFWLIWINLT